MPEKAWPTIDSSPIEVRTYPKATRSGMLSSPDLLNDLLAVLGLSELAYEEALAISNATSIVEV